MQLNREPRIRPASGTHPRSATGCRPACSPWPRTGYAQKVNKGKREKHWRVKKELNIHDCDDEEKQVDTRRNTFPCRDQKSIFLYMMLGTETQQESATKRKSAIKSLELFSCNRFHPPCRINILLHLRM